MTALARLRANYGWLIIELPAALLALAGISACVAVAILAGVGADLGTITYGG